MAMRVAITGGSGFIGAAVVRAALDQGYEAWTFDRSNGDDVLGDLKSLKGADAVIHLAGVLGTHELFDTVEDAIQQNVVGSYRVMQWCLDNNATYVGITMPDVFPSIYTATKVATQRLATALHHSRGLKCAHIRAFNAFGPGQKYGPGHPQKIVPTFSIKAWHNEPIPIWGDGTQTVDLIHIDDIAEILLRACHLTDNQFVDAGSSFPLTVNEVAEFVLKVTHSTAGVEHLPMRDGETPTQIVAQGEGWDVIAWDPGDEFEWDKLRETIRWYWHRHL